jgi:penicillin-binding protein 2
MRKLLLPSLIIVAEATLLVITYYFIWVINDTFKLKIRKQCNQNKIHDYPGKFMFLTDMEAYVVSNQKLLMISWLFQSLKSNRHSKLCQLLNITKEDYIDKIAKAKLYDPRLPSVFLPQLNKGRFAAFGKKYENLKVSIFKNTFLA